MRSSTKRKTKTEREWEQLAELEERVHEEFQERARESLLGFTLYTKPKYNVGWHHKVLCKYLDKFAKGEIKRLMVFMPPRHGKSELVSRRLPAYILGKNPNAKIISASYSADLANQMSRDTQKIMESPAYLDLFPETRLVRTADKGGGSYVQKADQFEVVGYEGGYRAAGVGGGLTGMGADFGIIDDPIKNHKEADSPTFRESVWQWYQSTFLSRLEKNDSVLLTLTRWHEDDLAGRLLKLAASDPEADQWVVIKFPAIREPEPPEPKAEDVLSFRLDKREVGQPLWPWKFDLPRLTKLRASLGTRFWNALYQQRPSAAEGTVIKRAWIRYYRQLPAEFDEIIQSWDLAVEGRETSDYCAGQVWGRKGADCYLIHRVKEQADFPRQISLILAMTRDFPKAFLKIVEAKANGPAVMAALKKKVVGLVGYDPDRSKEARLSAVSPMFEGGNVYLPHSSICPGIDEYVEELVTCPNAPNDDEADATTQALLHMHLKASDLENFLRF